MGKRSKQTDAQRRERIQEYFWDAVGSVEHISLPRLEAAVKKEFEFDDDRLIQAQIDLMTFERRISIESRVKVWIINPYAK